MEYEPVNRWPFVIAMWREFRTSSAIRQQAYQSFRNARAGEVGDRNIDTLRLPSYISLDAGLSKSFNMWYAEGHSCSSAGKSSTSPTRSGLA